MKIRNKKTGEIREVSVNELNQYGLGGNMYKHGGQHGGLDRWFAEKWVDVKTGKPCGRQEGEDRNYPACRPSKRISSATPKTASELSSSEKQRFKQEKTSSQRISYNHNRKEYGGDVINNYIQQYKKGGNVNYIVKKGETLSKIAKDSNIPSYMTLAKLNNIKNPDYIQAGQGLYVPNKKVLPNKVTNVIPILLRPVQQQTQQIKPFSISDLIPKTTKQQVTKQIPVKPFNISDILPKGINQKVNKKEPVKTKVNTTKPVNKNSTPIKTNKKEIKKVDKNIKTTNVPNNNIVNEYTITSSDANQSNMYSNRSYVGKVDRVVPDKPGLIETAKGFWDGINQRAIGSIQKEDKEAIVKKPLPKSKIKRGFKELYTVRDMKGGKKDSLLASTYTGDNDTGTVFQIGNMVANLNNPNQTFQNAEGVAHFIMDGDVLPNQTHTEPYYDARGQFVKSNVPGKFINSSTAGPDDYSMFYRPNNQGSYNILYKQNKFGKPYLDKGWQNDLYVRSVPYSNIDWEGEGPSTGYFTKSNYIPLKNNMGATSIPYKNKSGYSRFSGGSGIYIYKDPITNREIQTNVTGSPETLKQVGESIINENKIDPNTLTFLYHDMGSYSAKPKARPDGTLGYNQWRNFNTYNRGRSGAPIIIPKQEYGGENLENIDNMNYMKSGGNVPTNPELWSRAKAAARSKYDVYPCVPMDSQALTKEGWKHYNELSIGEDILAYNQETNKNEWTPIISLQKFEDAPIIRLYKSQTNFDIKCTPNHKWVLAESNSKYPDNFVEAKDITKHMKIKISAELSDNGNGLNLNTFFKKDSWVKNILKMSISQIQSYFASGIVYDGHDKGLTKKENKQTYGFSQKEKDHGLAMEIAAVLLGYRVCSVIKKHNPTMMSWTFIRRNTESTQNLHKEDAGTSDVWCPTTKFGTWVMKQNGYVTITGNSAYANGFASKWYKQRGGGWRKAEYGMEVMGNGGVPNNPGFNALPEYVQQNIINNMAAGGQKMPPKLAYARFAAAGNLDQLGKYGYQNGGNISMYNNGGEPDGEMALGQIDAAINKLTNLRKFIQPNSNLEPWVSSKLTMVDDYANSVSDYMMYNPETKEMMELPMEEMEYGGGIPERYRNMGFTSVGAKKQSTRPGKKWMVLAKKGDDYKVVHGGYKGMQDFKQHHSEQRKENFWNRMGGRNSSKATDPFSPLYWHKRFGTWEQGGQIPMAQDGVIVKKYIQQTPYPNYVPEGNIYQMPVMDNLIYKKPVYTKPIIIKNNKSSDKPQVTNNSDNYTKASKYLSRDVLKGATLKASDIADAIEKFKKKTGYDYPLDLLLTQAQQETHFGRELKSEHNYFNVGNDDDGNVINFASPEESLLNYMDLVYNDYLQKGKKDYHDLLVDKAYVNYAGKRYASDPLYEKKLRDQSQFINRFLNKNKKGGQYMAIGGQNMMNPIVKKDNRNWLEYLKN
jgi:hypothetical protein